MVQLLLPLAVPPKFGFENLVLHEGINAPVEAIRSVYGTPRDPLPSLYLWGPSGTGKTHILKAVESLLESSKHGEGATCPYFKAGSDAPSSLAELRDLVTGNEALPDVWAGVAIDDVHLIAESDYAHIFNLFNKLNRVGAPLLLSSTQPPEQTFSHDAHLISRVMSGLVFGIEPPGDNARILILDKIARDKNIRVSQDVCRFLVTRKSRNIRELEKIVTTLDTASLRFKRRITIPFIKLLENEGVL
ncbi:DnaA ATPase domain-containing protein [Thermodesulfobacteriota bacterium]